MPETIGDPGGREGRKPGTLRKLERLARTFRHEEPDRVPVSDFFWGSFVERWRRELGLAADADPYRYYDLDWVVTTPNMDPWIRPFETLDETRDEVVVRTGFGAVVRKRFAYPMPMMEGWEIDSLDKLEAAAFDPPDDPRRFFAAGDNQIAGVGDGFQRDSPPWIETVESLRPDFPVYGSMIEVSECLTRLVGQHRALLWIGLEPERMGRAISRLGEFYAACAEAELAAAAGRLDGFVIWGDVAYKRSLFFSPAYWRAWFKPWVRAMAAAAHARGLPVIYHGCGNVAPIIEDLIEAGIDALNPLEAKAGLDAVDLRRAYGRRLTLCGNGDIRIWESGDPEAVRRDVMRKLNAAKGGGFIFQSDHSVTAGVSGRTYDGIVALLRARGTYPLDLGAFDEAV